MLNFDLNLLDGRYVFFPDGSCFSLLRKTWMTPAPDKDGYLRLSLALTYKCKTKTNILVSRAVAGIYIPNPLGLPCVNHKDGDKTNNHVTNLEWCSFSENRQHAWSTGLYEKGNLLTRKGKVRQRNLLSSEQREEMKLIWKSGVCASMEALGKAFGVSRDVTFNVLHDRTFVREQHHKGENNKNRDKNK